MDVSIVQMDVEEAKEKLAAYRNVLSNRHNKAIETEFDAIEQAYQELAKGTPLIDPFEAIRTQGWRADGRPVLAMARADQTTVAFSIWKDSRSWSATTMSYTGNWSPCEWAFDASRGKRGSGGSRVRDLHLRVEGITTEPPVKPKAGSAMVPLVPAEAYPARGLDLAKYFVLWEVENWDQSPPVDPMLLKPIGGNLYAVIHQWDLTEIERMIIAGTRKNA